MKPYPIIVGLLMATVLLPVTVIILFVAAFRGRWERKRRERVAGLEHWNPGALRRSQSSVASR
jgi:hypothetical protein